MSVENVEHFWDNTDTTTQTIEGDVTIAGEKTVLTANKSVQDLLEQILIELKKMNLRDEAVTGEHINEGDIL